jgi:predicted glycogen debranching enzyme
VTVDLVRRIPWPAARGLEQLLSWEWLVTNGLGGYASGTVSGLVTRRFHGLLIASLPDPFGRVVMLTHLWERLRLPDRTGIVLSGEDDLGTGLDPERTHALKEFRLTAGLPGWRYEVGDVVLEKQLLMPHRQNTVHVSYRLLTSPGPVRLILRPSINLRPHEAPVNTPLEGPYTLTASVGRYELAAGDERPPLRLAFRGEGGAFTIDEKKTHNVLHPVEESRGYHARGDLWSPGYFRADLVPGGDGVTLIASAESWEAIDALGPAEARAAETERRGRLISLATPAAREGPGAELVLAADQFVIVPQGRHDDHVRARALGDELRSVIAGYHWFTDWGRDTMISLEGLTLATGRHLEAGYILRTFAAYVRDGLIPNLFPEGDRTGLYHTADATLWYFHALDRYLGATGDRGTLQQLLPTLLAIVRAHLAGTQFGIRVDPRDGLLEQGAPGYQLTWMDAKVEDWVVTPRRGKAVEINALWYSALRLLQQWLEQEGRDAETGEIAGHAELTQTAFNARFWYEEGGYCYDVVDGDEGDDPACRPNQILAVALAHPVLEASRWKAVVEVVRQRLLTPVGLRSLAPGHRDYKPRYYGDLRARDAAYHQGTVWAWLIGPFIDAWLRLYPEDHAGARALLEGLVPQLGEACIGSLSEIFDAQEPFTARGCVSQAWSVAEVLRAWVKTAAPGEG